jgi:hypothetical protein
MKGKATHLLTAIKKQAGKSQNATVYVHDMHYGGELCQLIEHLRKTLN